MSRDSEIRYLAGCLGVAGETRQEVLKRAVLAHGPSKLLCRPLDKEDPETAGDVYRNLFGESP